MSARDVHAAFAERLDQLLATPGVAERITRSAVTVAIHCGDDSQHAFTLLLDREPPELIDGAAPDAAVQITAPAATWLAFLAADVHLASAIVRDEVTYSGPVRRFLRLAPILRALAREPIDEEVAA